MTLKDAKIARVILRALQREPGLTRTRLTVQVRPYGPEWLEVLKSLMDQGLVDEHAVIVHPMGTNKRAAIAYYLAKGPSHLDYEFSEPEAVAQFLANTGGVDFATAATG